jgi:hypothetical protein
MNGLRVRTTYYSRCTHTTGTSLLWYVPVLQVHTPVHCSACLNTCTTVHTKVQVLGVE